MVCPQCDRMLRIPRAGESIPALVQPSDDQGEIKREVMSAMEQMEQMEHVGDPVVATPIQPTQPRLMPNESENPMRRRKKRKERSHDAESEWVKNPKARLRFSRKPSYLSWWLASSLLVVILAVVLVLLLLDRKKSTVPSVTETTPSSADIAPVVVTVDPGVKALNAKKKQMNEIKMALASAEKFIAAPDIPAMLECVRGGAVQEARMLKYYEKQPYQPLALEAMDRNSGVLLAEGKAYQVIVRDSQNIARALVLLKEGDRYLVDWESWVGWSDMSWEEIKEKKPLTPTAVRVIVSAESYYNFDFPTSAEKDWLSYRLDFVGEDRFLYGYLRRDSPVINQMRPIATDSNGAMILKIRYVEAGSHPTQVVIDSVESDSWIKDLPR